MNRPPKIQKRSQGQTVVYDEEWEWIYAPYGLTEATWRQIDQLRRQGHRIQVIDWGRGIDWDYGEEKKCS